MKKISSLIITSFLAIICSAQQVSRPNLITEINTNFYTNSQKKITGDMLNAILKKLSDSQVNIITDGTPVVYATAPLSIATNTISISQSGAATNGYLSSTNWNTFNNKQNALTAGTGISISTNTITNTAPDQTVTISGATGTYPTFTVTPGWSLLGNSGTVDGTNFIGTTDNIPFNIYTNNTRRIKITNAGLVGIGTGTTTPTSKLHLIGDGFTSATYGLKVENSLGITLAVRDDGYVGIQTLNPDKELHVVGTIKSVGTTTTSASYGLQIHNSTGTNNALMVRNDGNVGIGTSSPAATLDIANTFSTSATSIFKGASASGTHLSLLSNGWLGLGATASLSKFQVLSTTAIEDYTIKANGTNLNFEMWDLAKLIDIKGLIRTYAPDHAVADIFGNGDLRMAADGNGTAGKGIYLKAWNGGSWITGLVLKNTAASPVLLSMFPDGTGNVGIGTATPTAKMDIRAGTSMWMGAVTTYTANATVTAAELAGGTLRVTGTATVTLTLPTATNLGTQMSWVANTSSVFPFTVLNESTGVVTLVVGAGITVSTYPTITDANELIIPVTATGVLQIASYSATAANIKRIQ